MSQRDSGYARLPDDRYETPEWVTEALLDHLPRRPLRIWEPACGSGKMVRELMRNGYHASGSDISTGCDFLRCEATDADAVITNPPYLLATEFIKHARKLVPTVAMLLRTDFDHAKTRQYLFGKCDEFYKKVVLTKRIRWIEDSKGQPSFNHAWFIWDRGYFGPPQLAYH